MKGIARKVAVSTEALRRLNGLSRKDVPAPGTYLKVPLGETDAVDQPGTSTAAAPPRSDREDEARAKTRTSRRRSYVVRKGDTLIAIAVRHSVTLAQLQEANDWSPGQRLLAGQILILPGPAANTDGATTPRAAARPERKSRAASVYKVRKGEGLEQIARRFGTDVDTLCRLNNLRRDRPLYVDRMLVLPRPPSP
jgi:peptidoglycan endopeptidase LytE